MSRVALDKRFPRSLPTVYHSLPLVFVGATELIYIMAGNREIAQHAYHQMFPDGRSRGLLKYLDRREQIYGLDLAGVKVYECYGARSQPYYWDLRIELELRMADIIEYRT